MTPNHLNTYRVLFDAAPWKYRKKKIDKRKTGFKLSCISEIPILYICFGFWCITISVKYVIIEPRTKSEKPKGDGNMHRIFYSWS